MRMWGCHGRRPQIWWAFEAAALGLTWPGYFRERSYLYDHGVLSQQERHELEAEWKAAFDAARGMGAAERREHLQHHDVPAELVKRWADAARRQSGRGAQRKAPSAEEVVALQYTQKEA
jgi:hypothetical protein